MQPQTKAYMFITVITIQLLDISYLADMIDPWIAVPSPELSGRLGSTVHIKWQYKCPDKLFGYSKLFYDSNEIAVRYIVDTSYNVDKKEFNHTITGSWNISIVISELKKTDNGIYCCYVECKNQQKKRRKTCTKLTTYEPPKIYNDAKNLSCIDESNAKVYCNARGDPKPTIYWTKISSNYIIDNSTLSLNPMTGNGLTWIYCCHAYNDFGNDTSCMSVTTTAKPHSIHIYREENNSYVQGSKFTLQCKSSGYPVPILQWEKNHSNIRMENSSSQLIQSITGKRSGGQYCCHAKNKCGKQSACTTINVTEYEPVSTVLKSTSIHTIKNQTFKVLCTADASPPATFTLYRRGETLVTSSNGSAVIVTSNNDTFENISCIPHNKYGQGTQRFITIPIYESPSFINKTDAITMVTSSVTLYCIAKGIPKPNITWMDKSNRQLDSKMEGRLTITHENCGNKTLVYYCKASNLVGSTKSQITVKVLRKCSNIETEASRPPFNIVVIVVAATGPLFILVLLGFFICHLRKKKRLKEAVVTDNMIRRNQARKYPEEESPYGDPIDAIQVSSSYQTSSGNYATVEETGYRRVGDVNYLPASGIKVDDTAYATVLNSKMHCKKPKADPVYAGVNKKNKKKKNKNNVHSIPLSEDIPCNKPTSTPNSMRPSSQIEYQDEQLMNHPDYENALDKCNEKCKNEELDGLDGSGQTSTGYSWAY